MNLEELEAKEKRLRVELRQCKLEIKAEQERLALEKYGVKVGSIIADKKGNEFRIIEVDARYSWKPSLKGNPKNKDGVFGKAERNIYGDEWTVLKT